MISYRKDDYAFFLHPVNVSEVPGYSAIVKRPMDFGTMTNKVARGKYRSLEDFTVRVLFSVDSSCSFRAVRPAARHHEREGIQCAWIYIPHRGG